MTLITLAECMNTAHGSSPNPVLRTLFFPVSVAWLRPSASPSVPLQLWVQPELLGQACPAHLLKPLWDVPLQQLGGEETAHHKRTDQISVGLLETPPLQVPQLTVLLFKWYDHQNLLNFFEWAFWPLNRLHIIKTVFTRFCEFWETEQIEQVFDQKAPFW